MTIAPGQSVTFGGSGSDPDNNLPLTYAWNFGAGGPPASTSQNPGAVVFPNAGVFTVTFTVRDSLGTPDPYAGNAHRDGPELVPGHAHSADGLERALV